MFSSTSVCLTIRTDLITIHEIIIFNIQVLLDNICISIMDVFLKDYIYYYCIWQYNLVNYHMYTVIFQLFLEVSMSVQVYDIQLHYKQYIFISILLFYTFIYNMLSIVYYLLSGIYLLVRLVILFKIFIVFYFISNWFQRSDSVYETNLLFKSILWKIISYSLTPQLIWKCSQFFVTITMAVNSP